MAESIVIDMAQVRAAESMSFEDAVHHMAVIYAKAGIPVLPLEPDSKKLPGGGGINYMSASSKEHVMHKWFGPDGKYRGFNIGIGCGTKHGVMALDVDAKPTGGTTGLKEIARITEKEGPLPPGPRQKTPSGGYHYIYLWQDNAVSSSGKVANGIDTRGGTVDRCTGHIVVFPSQVGGKSYAWEEGGEVPPMPNWLDESLGQPWREKPKETQPKQEVPVHQINRMLTIIDPDALSYEDWVKVGMALKSTCGEDGLELWDEWSAGGARRKNNECKIRWKTFQEDGPVGFGTLLFMAKEAGWRPLPGDVHNSNLDAEIEERVLEMNKHYALVRMSKNLLVATFSNNGNGEKIGFLSMQSFITMAMPDKIQIPTRNGFAEKAMTDVWLSSPQRRAYYDVGIYPNGDEPAGTLNLWNGWGAEPDPKASCKHYLQHMKDVICDGADHIYQWLLDWMADCVQDSRTIKGSCVVLRGIEGCGKGAWADQFGQLFGKHYTHLIDAERLTTKFNSLTADSVVVFADEVLWPGDRKAANVLKGLISERRVTREAKGIDSIEVDNLNHVIIASNEDWIIPAGPQSRRWLVLNVNGSVACNKPYFDRLFKEMEEGGREALLHLLKTRKITSNLRLAPHTKGLTEQRRLSHRHDSMLHFLTEAVMRGGFDSTDVDASMGDAAAWPKKLLKFELFSEYRTWCRDTRITTFDTLSMIMFVEKLPTYGFEDLGKEVKVPTIGTLRVTMDQRQGTHQGEVG
jgi:hypothetical protein